MTCVIVNHSKLSSFVSWFSYERLWIVTAAEVFVVLSGVVLGMVYGRRLVTRGWKAVIEGLGRRALTLYLAFIAMTLSIVCLSLTGVDVTSVAAGSGEASNWFMDPRAMDLAAWRDLALMRSGPWPFEIVGLYVWLVAAAIPCFVLLRFVGSRGLLAASWTVYLVYRIEPHRLTNGEFERVFPILAWQLLFVHGIAIGYHRESIAAALTRHWTAARRLLVAAAMLMIAFMMLALSNPWADGPWWLHWHLVSPERFAYLYGRYFALSDLGLGRIVNLAIGLPLAYTLLGRLWAVGKSAQTIFVTLGQQSLGAFVLHVYGILIVAQVPHPHSRLGNAVIQIGSVVAIAAILHALQQRRARTRELPHAQPQPLAA